MRLLQICCEQCGEVIEERDFDERYEADYGGWLCERCCERWWQRNLDERY